MTNTTLAERLRNHPNRRAALQVMQASEDCRVLGEKLQSYGDGRELTAEEAKELDELGRLAEGALERMRSGLLELDSAQQNGRPKAADRLLSVFRGLVRRSPASRE